MAATYSIKANASPVQISNTEITIAQSQQISNALAVGDAIRIRLFGSLDNKSQYTFNVRFGANGNTSDNAIFTSNNVITKAQLLTDLNNWANAHPGLSYVTYAYTGTLPQLPQTPAALQGELLLVVTGTGANGNIAVTAPVDLSNNQNLLEALGTGLLTVANSVNTNTNNFVSVSMAMVGPGAYVFNPLVGVEGPGNHFVYNQAPNTNTSIVSVSTVEVL